MSENSNQMRLFSGELLLPSEESAIGVQGVDDINIVEILLGLPGKRRPPKGKTISTPWEKGERSYHLEYSQTHLQLRWSGRRRDTGDEDEFFVHVRSPEDKGLPTQRAEDVLIALLELSARQGFEGPQVRTTRHELLEVMQWPKSKARGYERLTETLSQMVNLNVETNALWDPVEERYFHSEFSILDSTDLDRSSGEHDKATYVTWGHKMFSLFSKGYLKQLNTQFYYSLSSGTAKRIYRWLDAKFRFHSIIQIDALRFAHKELGLGASYQYPSQVKQKLVKHLDELEDRGYCRWQYTDAETDSGKKFVFSRITLYSAVLLPRRSYIVSALRERGVHKADEIVDEHGWEHCIRMAEYFDYLKQRDPEKITNDGAWLASAIREGRNLPAELEERLNQAREETADWCDRIWSGLTDEEQAEIHQEIRNRLREVKGADPESPSPKVFTRMRNRILLDRTARL